MAVADWLRRVRDAARRHSGLMTVIAVVAFGLTAWFAFRSLPEGTEVRLLPVLGLVVLAPLTTAANAAEFAAIGAAIGQHVTPGDATRTAVLSSAANLLPLPGAVAVRAHRLRAAGYRRSITATTAAGICWLGTALAVGAAANLVVDPEAATLVPLAAGAAGLVASWVLLRRSADPGRAGRAWLAVVACELAQVGVAAVRYALAVLALDQSVTVAQSLGLAIAPVAASAVGILPGGLGVREAIAASVAALVDLPASVGAAATALDRVVGLTVLALLAAVVLRHTDGGEPRRGDETP